MARRGHETRFIFGARRDSSFNRTIGSIRESIGGLVKSAAALTSAYAGISGLKTLGQSAIESASNLEGYRSTLNVVMKDEKKAAQTMKWAVDFANKTPFETDSIVEAAVRLQSYGLDAQKVMTKVGDMAGVMNKDVMEAVEAVADAQTGELERMKEFGITKAMIQKKAGEMFVNQEIINNKGQIVEQEKFNESLFALMEDKFKGGMDIQSNTFKGLVSTIKGIWSTGLASIAGMSADGEIIDGGAFDGIKEGLQKASGAMQKFSDSGGFIKISQKIGASIQNIKKFAKATKEAASSAGKWLSDKFSAASNRIKEKLNELLPKLNEIKSGALELAGKLQEAFINAFKSDIFGSLITESIPNLLSMLSNVLDFSLKMGNFIADNWGVIGPILAGVVAGIAAFKTISTVISVIGKVKLAITALRTVMNGASLLAMLANPAGIAAVAIGLIVAAIILLVKNWDKIKPAISAVWEKIKEFGQGAIGLFKGIGDKISEFVKNTAASFLKIGDSIKNVFQGVGDWFSSLWDGISNTFKNFINTFIGGINWIIGALNKISFTAPDWLPGELAGKTIGINIPKIPMLANGGVATKATLAMVGEGKENEAILPLSKLQNLLQTTRHQENKPPLMDRVLQFTPFIQSERQSSTAGVQINWSPVYHLHGSAGKNEIKEADEETRRDFTTEWNKNEELKRRTAFRK